VGFTWVILVSLFHSLPAVTFLCARLEDDYSELGAHSKFWNPTTTPSGEEVQGERKKKEEKKKKIEEEKSAHAD
jgi:hypothetical protein